MNLGVVFGKWICRKVPFFKDFELPQNELGKFLYVFEKADYPRKDNSNYPYSFFSNLLPLLISAIGKLNKINILFENRRVFGVFTMWKNKKALGYGRSPHISRLNFFLLDANQFYLFQDNNVCPLHSINLALILYLICIQISMVYRFAFNHTAKIPHN